MCHHFGRNPRVHVRTVKLPEPAVGFKGPVVEFSEEERTKRFQHKTDTLTTVTTLTQEATRHRNMTPSTRPCVSNCTQRSHCKTWVAGECSLFPITQKQLSSGPSFFAFQVPSLVKGVVVLRRIAIQIYSLWRHSWPRYLKMVTTDFLHELSRLSGCLRRHVRVLPSAPPAIGRW